MRKVRQYFTSVMLSLTLSVTVFNCKTTDDAPAKNRLVLADSMETHLREQVLDKWYPQSVDTVFGGFFSTYTYDFQLTGPQDKMIVTQARHVWVNAKAAEQYPDTDHYLKSAAHGFRFLRDVMWDKQYGGFHTLVDREGNVKSDEKNAYGNAFGIYALAAYYHASQDTSALSLAKKAFLWLEEHSHDAKQKGYFQFLSMDGTPLMRQVDTPSASALGYKDQNSSIHLLEAFTELYQVWPDSLVRERLSEMLHLVRDVITTPEGSLTLFLHPDWTPVSFRDSSEEIIMQHHHLDHLSFGHDVETAYLMLEASHVLGIENDTLTMQVAKRMVDQALRIGWDHEAGGFYDEGYSFKTGYRVIRDSKNWWAQAEGLNSLLLMADFFPDDEMHYYDKFRTLWKYTNAYLIDHEHGDWYAGGLDKQPEMKTALKGQIWKGTYHHYRSLANCIQRLRHNGAYH